MNGLNTHIYDKKTKNIESNNNFNIKENKGPSEEEQNEFRNKLEEEKTIQKEKQDDQVENLKSQLNENSESKSIFLNSLSENENGKEFFNKLKKRQKSNENIRNIKDPKIILNKINLGYEKKGENIELIDVKGENIELIDVKGINIPIVLSSKKGINQTVFEALLNIPDEIKDNMNKTLDFILIQDNGINGEAEYEKGFGLKISNEYPSKLYANQIILHEFAHIQHFILLLSNNDFRQKLDAINKGVPELETGCIAISGQQKELRTDTILKNEFDFSNMEEVLKGNPPQKRILKTGQKITTRSGKILLGENEELNLTEDPIGGHKYLRSAMEPRYGFISPYSYSKSEKKPIGKILGYEDIEIRSEELSNIVEEYYEDKDHFINITIGNKEGKKLMLNEKYDIESKHPLIRQKLRLMIENGFFPKREFNQCFEK